MARRKSSSTLATASSSDLEAALKVRSAVDKLESQKAGIKAQIDDIDAQIGKLLGKTPVKRRGPKPGSKRTGKKPGPKPGAKRVQKKPGRKAGAKAGRKKVSVTAAAESVLKEVGKPMKVAELSDILVNQKGVKSKAKSFYSSLTATLNNSPKFEKVGKGLYGLASGEKKVVKKKAAKKKAVKKAKK